MRARKLFAVAVTLLLTGPSTKASAAAWSPDGSHIVYSFIGGPENLYLMNADGSQATELVIRPERDFRAEWAPDGSHIIFTSVVDGVHVISRVNPDGSGLMALTRVEEAAGDPDYSPDGRKLLYFTDEPQPRELYYREVSTGRVTQLTDTPDFDEASPRWAPDGRRVVFVGNEAREDAEGDLWILDTESGERRQLSATPTISEFHPDWSHDGSRIVYVRVEDGNFAVATRDIASGKETIVADGNGYAVLSPHFSPDDGSLSFTRTDFAEKGEGMPAIVEVDLESGRERTLVKGLYLSQMAGSP